MLQSLLRPLPINYGVLDQSFAQIENRVLNKCGYVPILGSYIGMARMVVGVAQIVMSIVIPIFNIIRGSLADRAQQKALLEDGIRASTYAAHGIPNFIRGQIELVFCGGLVCLIYDWAGYRINYEEETLPPNTISPLAVLRTVIG